MDKHKSRYSNTRFDNRFRARFCRYVAPLMRATFLGSPVIHLRVRRLAQLEKGQKVLELASGPVPYYKAWQSKIGGKGELVVSDIDPWIVEVNRKLGLPKVAPKSRRPGVRHKIVNINRIKGFENYFDRVIAISPFRLDTLQGIHKALRPGGKALIFTITDNILVHQLLDRLNRGGVKLEIEKEGYHSMFLFDTHQYTLLRKPKEKE